MNKREELDIFLTRADEFIEGKYILADIKIVNLLKAIAASETLVAIFKNCLTDFDYYKASKTYLVKSSLSDDKGEFVPPSSSKELLAFVFNVLVDIDAGKIKLGEFIDKYFYEDGSMYSGYKAFMSAMIIPFKNSVKVLMESVIEGKLQDPLEAISEEEKRREIESENKRKEMQKEKELSEKTFGAAIKGLKELLLSDKKRVKESKLKERNKTDLTLIIDMLANAAESSDKDAVNYAFTAYKYAAKCHKILFFGSVKKAGLYIKDIINGLD